MDQGKPSKQWRPNRAAKQLSHLYSTMPPTHKRSERYCCPVGHSVGLADCGWFCFTAPDPRAPKLRCCATRTGRVCCTVDCSNVSCSLDSFTDSKLLDRARSSGRGSCRMLTTHRIIRDRSTASTFMRHPTYNTHFAHACYAHAHQSLSEQKQVQRLATSTVDDWKRRRSTAHLRFHGPS